MRYRSILAAAFLGALFLSSNALGERVDVYGVPLEIDSIETVDSKLSRVTLFGETALVGTERVAEAVLAAYLANLDRVAQIQPKEVVQIVERSVAERRPELAAHLFTTAAQVPGIDLEIFKESLGRLRAGKDGSIDFFKDASLRLRERPLPHPIAAEVLFGATRREPVWVRENVAGLLFIVGDDFRALAEQSFVEAVLQRKYDSAFEIARAIRAVLGEGDRLAKRLHAYRITLESARQADEQGSVDELYRLLDASRNDVVMNSLLGPLAYDATLRVASSHLDANRPIDTILVLTKVEANQRTPRFHELLRKAIVRISAGPDALIENPQIMLLLTSVGTSDEYIRARHLQLLHDQVKYLAAIDQTGRSESVFNALRRIRPDPDKGNDLLRVEQALSYLRKDSWSLANEKLAGVQEGISLLSHARLFFAGYYISQLTFALILIASAIGVSILLMLRILRIRGLERDISSESLSEDRDGEENPHGNRPAFIGRGKNPLVDEYRRCLAVLDLEPGVSISGIKGAYRTAVKQHHPDLQIQDQGATPDRFIELTQAYERAVELHRELGYS